MMKLASNLKTPLMQIRGLKINDVRFQFFSVAIGLLAAAGAMLFRYLIEIFKAAFWPEGPFFMDMVANSPWWLILLIPALAGLLAGPLVCFLAPEAKGPGVTEIILSVARRESSVRHRVTFVKALASSLLIGGGASVGREGPIVQIGASAASSLARLFKLDPDLRRVCLASGAAAGIAATFNAPMAGTLFAVEIILLDIKASHIANITVSAITGSIFARIFHGDFPSFRVQPFELASYQVIPPYLILGLLSGITAIVFVRSISGCEHMFKLSRIPDWLKPCAAGLILGLIALAAPEVLGVGYESMNMALAGGLGLSSALILLAAKGAAASICIGSGMSGGIFAPSLVLGSALGAAVGTLTLALFPDCPVNPTNFALIGMAGVVSGTTLAPITAILTIFELSYAPNVILPLMIVCISSSSLVRLLFGYSAYEMRLLKQGVSLVRGHETSVLTDLKTRGIMRTDFETIEEYAPLLEVVRRVMESSYPHFVVLGREGKMSGVLSLRDLRGCLDSMEELEHLVLAADLMTRKPVVLSTRDNLQTALLLFEKKGISFIPLHDPAEPKKVVGIVKKDDLIQAYHEQALKDRVISQPLK